MSHLNNNKILRTDLTKRIYGLDILRTIAILCVLCGHTYEYLPEEMHTTFNIFTRDGVSIFFILSGFLIGGILIKMIDKEKFTKRALLKFWINRWLRTLPPYYFALILLIIIALTVAPNLGIMHLEGKQVFRYFVFLQNFKIPHYGFFAESWSLSVEEWFYIIVPLVIITLNRVLKLKTKTTLLLTIILLIVAVNIIRTYRIYNGIAIDGHQVVMRLDALMYGVLGAFIAYYHNIFWNKSKYICFVLGILLYIMQSIDILSYIDISPNSYANQTFLVFLRMSWISVTVLLILPYLSSIKEGSGYIYKFLTYTSLISYSLYLLHYTFIKYAIIENIGNYIYISNIIKIILIWVLSYVLASVMYLYIERPSMNIRKKIKFLQR